MNSVAERHRKAEDGGRKQLRRRRPEGDRAIMEAARTLLTQHGYEGLTFDALAREAGVSRPTIYRRWTSKAALLEEIAFGTGKELPAALQDDDLRSLIRQILDAVTAYYNRPEIRPAVFGVLASMPSTQSTPCQSAIDAEKATRARVAALLDDAKRAGLLRQDVEANAFYDLAVGSVIYRRAFSYRRDMDDDTEALADILMRGVALPY